MTDSKKKIDLIICNAAQGVFGYVDEIKINEFKNDMDVNFYSHLLIIKSFLFIIDMFGISTILYLKFVYVL